MCFFDSHNKLTTRMLRLCCLRVAALYSEFTRLVTKTPLPRPGCRAAAAVLAGLLGAFPALSQTTEIIGGVDWDGNPLPGVTVDLENGDFGSPVLASTVTGSDGSFVISNPPTGQFTLYAVAPSNEYWQWAGYGVTVTPGQITNVGTLTLYKILQLTLRQMGLVFRRRPLRCSGLHFQGPPAIASRSFN